MKLVEYVQKNIVHIILKLKVKTCLKGFWTFDTNGIIDLGTKVNSEWV